VYADTTAMYNKSTVPKPKADFSSLNDAMPAGRDNIPAPSILLAKLNIDDAVSDPPTATLASLAPTIATISAVLTSRFTAFLFNTLLSFALA